MRSRTLGLAVASVLACSGSAMATTLFFDNFNTENGGVSQLNYNGFANWIVNPQSVDLIGNGNFDFYPGNGLYVDLDGSTRSAGTMTTRNSWTYVSGSSYRLEFNLGGNARGSASDTVTVAVQIGNVNQSYTLASGAPFQLYTIDFVGNGSTGAISFAGSGGDNIGIILDNVRLSVVPLPHAAGLSLVGLLSVAGFRRRMGR